MHTTRPNTLLARPGISSPRRQRLIVALVTALTLAINGRADTADSLLFNTFVDVVETDYQALDYAGPNDLATLQTHFGSLSNSATELNDNFELFDGDEVVLFIADIEGFEQAISDFRDTLANATLTSPDQAAQRDALLARLDTALADNAATRQVAESIRETFGLIRVGTTDYRPGTGGDLIVDIRDYLDELLRMITEAEKLFGETETVDVIQTVINEANEGLHLLGQIEDAAEQTDRGYSRTSHLRQAGGLRRNGPQRRPVVARPVPAAGGDWEFELAVDGSYATFEDRSFDIRGKDQEASVFISGTINDLVSVGFGLARDTYRIHAPFRLTRDSIDQQAYLHIKLNDCATVGVFADYARIDIEDQQLLILGQTIHLGDSYGRWGAGMLASFAQAVGPVDLGLTTSLASGNKSSLSRIFDDEDSAWATLMDASVAWNDYLVTTGELTYYTQLDNQTAVDASYWIAGFSFAWALNDRVSFTAGYETLLAYKDYTEHRWKLGAALSW